MTTEYYVFDSLGGRANYYPVDLSEAKKLAKKCVIKNKRSFKIKDTMGKLYVTYRYHKPKYSF
jgi:hypothetical protein